MSIILHRFMFVIYVLKTGMFFIEIKNCISVSDIVIAKIDQKNQHILKIHDANLGVLLSIGCQNHFMIPRNNYEMLCCVTQKRKFKKVSKLSLW